MPFKSFQELIGMSSRDPKMAMMYVNKAKSKNKPVVDENNSGYSVPQTAAIKNRLQKATPKKSLSEPTDSDERVAKNKINGY
jgi:hypothetical protein